MEDRDEELRQLFESRQPEQEFQFDQNNWNRFFTALKKKRQAKKRWIIYLNVLALIMGLGAYFAWKPSAQETKQNLAQSAQQETVTPSKLSGSLNPSSTPSLLSTKLPSSLLPKQQALSPTEDALKPDNSMPEKNPLSENPGKINSSSPVSNSQFLKAGLPEKLNKGLVDRLLASVGRVEIEIRPVSTIRKLNSVDQNQLTKDPASDLTFTKVQKTKPASGQVDGDDLEKEAAPDVLTPSITGADTLNNVPVVKTPSVVAVPNDSLLKVPAAKNDSLKTAEPEHLLTADLGTTFLAGWKNNGKKDGAGFNPVIGLTYYNTVADKIRVSVGIYYTSVGNLKTTSHTSTSTKYKFGEENYVTTISATRMHYLCLPLKVHYAIDKNNSIGLGYTLGVLCDVKSKVETYTRRFDVQGNYTISQAYGYREGFSNFDGQLALSYRRKIYKALFLNAELFYGIKDIKNNVIYNAAVFERNSGIKLSLSYNLFKK